MNIAARLLKSLRRNIRGRKSQILKKRSRKMLVEGLEDRRLLALYLDNNGDVVGFGTVSGNWDTTTSVWNTSSTGSTDFLNGGGILGPWSAPPNHDDAVIGGASGTITISPANVSAKSVSVNSPSGSNIVIAGTNSLTLTGTSPFVEVVTSNVTTVISAPIAGTSGLTKTGSGTLTVSGTNTYTGTTSVNAGTLQLNSDSGLGNTGTGNGTTVASGARVNLAGVTTSEAFTISGHGISATGAIITTGSSTVNGIVSLSANSTISTNSGVTLTLNGTSGTAISNATGTNPTLTFSSVGTIDIVNAVNLGNGGLDKGGAGSVILRTANDFNGQTTIGAGTLEIRNATALGATSSGVNLTGGTLALSNGIAVGAEPLTLTGSGDGNNGALRNLSGDNSWAGAITVAGSTRINSDAGTLTIDVASGNAIAGTNQNLTLGGVGNISVLDPIDTGTGTVTKDGLGTVTLGGSNNYTGTTTVSSGTLIIANNSALGSSTTGTTVQNGARVRLANGITTSEPFSIIGAGTTGAINNGSGTNTVAGKVTLAGAATIGAASGTLLIFDVSSGDAIDNNGNTLSVEGTGNIQVADPISGNGGLSKPGGGTLTLTAANTYSGATSVTGGKLSIQNSSALASTSSITVSGALELAGGITLARPVSISGVSSFNAGALQNLSGNNSVTGLVTLTAASQINAFGGTLTLDVASGNAISGTNTDLNLGRNADANGSATAGDIVIADPIATGSGSVTVAGTGTVTFSAANTYTGTTTVNRGTLLINGNQSSATGAITVANSATLGGTGTLGGALTVQSGGTLSPGLVGATGVLNTANVTFNSGSTFSVAVNGSTAGTGYDQVKATGTVALGNATLSTSGTIATGPGNTALVLIDNDGSDAVTGTFNGLAEGSTVVINGISFRISYVGGDGNDVTLNHLAQPVLTITSGDRAYNGSVYAATTSITGDNTPTPTISYTYYSDAAGTITISAPTNTGTYYVMASSAANSGNLAATSPLKTFQITRVALSITPPSIASKVYDRTTAAGTLTIGTLSGFIGSETVTATGLATAYSSADVGSYSSTVSYTLNDGNNGGLASNYSLANGTATGSITAKSLTITGLTGNNKTYDATTSASASGTAALSGVISGDTVTLSGTGSFVFANKNVGSSKPITASGYSLEGASATNYSVSQPSGLTGNITAASLTVTGISGNSRVYDATTNASVSGNASLSGILSTDVVTLGGTPSFTFADKNVANGKSISATGYTISGTDAGNYTLSQPSGLTGNVTRAPLTVTGITGSNKTYDGNTTATVSGTAALSGAFGGDNLSLGGTAAFTFADKDVGTGKSITASGYTISGTDSGNYSLSQPSGLTGSITAKTLTITADAKSKFVGQADPALTYNQSGLVDGDSITGSLTRVAGEAVGVYAIQQGTLDAGSNYTINYNGANLTITAITLSSVAINGGVAFANPAQRSMITSMRVTFSTPVTLASNAFSLENIGLFTASSSFIPQSQLVITPSSGSSSVFTITFDAGSVSNGTTFNGVTKRGSGATASTTGNSLADGNYVLRIDSTKVTSGPGTLTGNNTFGATAADNFFRLYGDSNGDGRVDSFDTAAIRTALRGGAYNPVFDWDGNGSVTSGVDSTNFDSRINRRRRLGY